MGDLKDPITQEQAVLTIEDITNLYSDHFETIEGKHGQCIYVEKRPEAIPPVAQSERVIMYKNRPDWLPSELVGIVYSESKNIWDIELTPKDLQKIVNTLAEINVNLDIEIDDTVSPSSRDSKLENEEPVTIEYLQFDIPPVMVTLSEYLQKKFLNK